MFLRRNHIRALTGLLPLVGIAVVLSSHSGASPSPVEFRFRDDCDPATFNAPTAAGPGACIGNGKTTFAKFIAEVTEDKSSGAWRINPDQTEVDPGQPSVISNRGGELHTFTKVEKFGGGIVPPLNDLSGNRIPAPECLAQPPDKLTAGNIPAFPLSSTTGPAFPVGTSKYQCCIHPWMRSVVTVKAHH
jgi:hypothetical protein